MAKDDMNKGDIPGGFDALFHAEQFPEEGPAPLTEEELRMGITAVILPRMKTAVSVPDQLFDAADRFARRLGLSRSELYSKALQEYLGSHREEGITEALDRIYEKEDSSLDPVLASIQAFSLPKGEW
ncbi:MAG TPA: hypothetical protein VLT87_04725 [Thermoanaerobaculia bacterium]|nr:hypothetical protein [Thermoanaerobaculia bacterium]